MGIKTIKVTLTSGEVGRAVKVSERNIQATSLWCNGLVLFYGKPHGKPVWYQRIRLRTRHGIRVAKIGDVIVKFKDATYKIIKAEDFSKMVKI